MTACSPYTTGPGSGSNCAFETAKVVDGRADERDAFHASLLAANCRCGTAEPVTAENEADHAQVTREASEELPAPATVVRVFPQKFRWSPDPLNHNVPERGVTNDISS